MCNHMHQFPPIREYKREVPSLTQSVEIGQSKRSHEKAIDTKTDELNERHNKQQRKGHEEKKISDSQSRRTVEYFSL